MKKAIKRAFSLSASAICAVLAVNTGVLAADTAVEVGALVSASPKLICFSSAQKPYEIDNTLYVPARITAESMGMTTGWDQSTGRATLIVDADERSDKPIERYAFELCSSLEAEDCIEPDDVSITFKGGASKAVVRYNFKNSDGNVIVYSKVTDLSDDVCVADSGTMMLPLRALTEALGLELEWDQDSRTASIQLPQFNVIPVDAKPLKDNSDMAEMEATVDIQEESESAEEDNLEYLGTFKITHYAPGYESNGAWGNATAWAGNITPGVTIAVDKRVISPLSWVYVDGYGYRRAEDCGGGVKGNHIDMAVPTHSMAMSMGVVYKDVYLCK